MMLGAVSGCPASLFVHTYSLASAINMSRKSKEIRILDMPYFFFAKVFVVIFEEISQKCANWKKIKIQLGNFFPPNWKVEIKYFGEMYECAKENIKGNL